MTTTTTTIKIGIKATTFPKNKKNAKGYIHASDPTLT